jgi:hypothetical protein
MLPTPSPPPTRDWRLWWFARLETALRRDDRRAAKEALRNLARLGVEVRFTLPPHPRDGGRARESPAPEGRSGG